MTHRTSVGSAGSGDRRERALDSVFLCFGFDKKSRACWLCFPCFPSLFGFSVIHAFQQGLKLLASPLLRCFFAPWSSTPVLKHRLAVIAHPAFMFAAAIGRPPPVLARSGSTLHSRPLVDAGSPIHADPAVDAASAIDSAAPLGDVLRV